MANRPCEKNDQGCAETVRSKLKKRLSCKSGQVHGSILRRLRAKWCLQARQPQLWGVYWIVICLKELEKWFKTFSAEIGTKISASVIIRTLRCTYYMLLYVGGNCRRLKPKDRRKNQKKIVKIIIRTFSSNVEAKEIGLGSCLWLKSQCRHRTRGIDVGSCPKYKRNN